MTDYSELVKALRYCWGDNKYGCGKCPYHLNSDEEGRCTAGLDAAAAIEELQAQLMYATDAAKEIAEKVPKRGEWNDHEVACLLAEMFGDDCACNLNGIDEWLPQYCEFAETCCPNPVGVACWEQFLKHRAKMTEAQE